MIIGQAPSTSGKLPSPRPALKLSKSAKFLCKSLREIRVDPDDCYFSNLVKCSIVEGEEGKPINCYPFLWDEIAKVNPKIILVLGSKAKKFLKKKHPNDKRFRFILHPAQRTCKREEYKYLLYKALEE